VPLEAELLGLEMDILAAAVLGLEMDIPAAAVDTVGIPPADSPASVADIQAADTPVGSPEEADNLELVAGIPAAVEGNLLVPDNLEVAAAPA
jgi:hypothetical protein